MALTKDQIMEIFQRTGGVLEGHFLLTSGRHSDTYMQCAKLFVDPADSKLLCADLATKLAEFECDIIASPALGGIVMGYEMAAQLGCKNVFFERVDGVFNLRRGFHIPEGARVIVVEDVVTTGGSVVEVVQAVQALGAKVVAVASIVDRSNGEVDFGLPFRALLSISVTSHPAAECPLCKAGMGAPVKPGSRSL